MRRRTTISLVGLLLVGGPAAAGCDWRPGSEAPGRDRGAAQPTASASPEPTSQLTRISDEELQKAMELVKTREEIQLAQQTLNTLGYGPLKTDGSYGPKTAAAVRAFQEDHDLPVTGQVDEKTLVAIISAQVAPEIVNPTQGAPTDFLTNPFE